MPADSSEYDSSGWKIYTNDALGYSFHYPAGAQVTTRLRSPREPDRTRELGNQLGVEIGFPPPFGLTAIGLRGIIVHCLLALSK